MGIDPDSPGTVGDPSDPAPPQDFNQVVEKQHERKSQQQLVGQINVVDVANEKAFNDKSHHTDKQRPDDQTQPEILAQEPQNREAAVGPQHVKAAVGKIQYPEYAENQRQTAGNQPDKHTGRQTGQAHMRNGFQTQLTPPLKTPASEGPAFKRYSRTPTLRLFVTSNFRNIHPTYIVICEICGISVLNRINKAAWCRHPQTAAG